MGMKKAKKPDNSKFSAERLAKRYLNAKLITNIALLLVFAAAIAAVIIFNFRTDAIVISIMCVVLMYFIRKAVRQKIGERLQVALYLDCDVKKFVEAFRIITNAKTATVNEKLTYALGLNYLGEYDEALKVSR